MLVKVGARQWGTTSIVILLLLVGPIVAFGQGTGADYYVRLCVEEVRKKTFDGNFDAYITSRGTLSMFGTQRQYWLMEKCVDHRMPGVWVPEKEGVKVRP